MAHLEDRIVHLPPQLVSRARGRRARVDDGDEVKPSHRLFLCFFFE